MPSEQACTTIDEPLAMYRNAATSFYEADGLGSITSLTDGTGAAAAVYTYDTFGKITSPPNSLTNPFQYTGREWDPETDLYYYRARYYDNAIGRFITEDRIRFLGGMDFYAYVHNRPADYLDPEGLAPEKKCDCSGNTGGLDKAKKCCANTSPRKGSDGPNPYKLCDTYMGVSARYMYRYGGDNPWGQLVRSCLKCSFQYGTEMGEAHTWCYQNSAERLGYTSYLTVPGFREAVGAAAQALLIQSGREGWTLEPRGPCGLGKLVK